MDIFDDIKKIYSQESGIDINDPKFWKKYSAFRDEQSDEYSPDDDNCCPYCGREME